MVMPHIANMLNLLCDVDFRTIMEEVDIRFSAGLFKAEITPKRLCALRRNLFDVVTILFSKGEVGLFDVDMGLREKYGEEPGKFPYVELGGGSVGAGIMLEYLMKLGIVERKGRYRLRREYFTLLAS